MESTGDATPPRKRNYPLMACLIVVFSAIAAGMASWLFVRETTHVAPDPAQTDAVMAAISDCPEMKSEIMWTARREIISPVDLSTMRGKALQINHGNPRHCSRFAQDLLHRERMYWAMYAGLTA